MSVKILSCQNSSCASLGATHLIRDLEELASGQCDVEEWGCLGKCGKGPNVEIQWKGGKSKVVEGVTSFKKALGLVQDKADVGVASNVQKLGKVKYDLRRENDAGSKQKLYKQCFDLLGGENAAAKSAPQQLAELLVMRSKDAVKSQVDAALKDAQKAAELAPNWAQAHLALGMALEAAQRYADGVLALKAALEIGKGINIGQIKRMITRTERKAKEQPDMPAPAPEPAKPEPAKPEPPAEKPKAAAKSSSKSSSAKSSADTPAKPSSDTPAEKPKAADTPDKVASSSKKKPSAKKSSEKDTKKASNDKDSKKPADKDAKKTGDSKKGKEGKDASATTKPEEVVELPPIQRSPLDLIDWRVEEKSQLNHNCILLKLVSTDLAVTSRDPDPGDVWHIDLMKEVDGGEEIKKSYTPISDAAAYKKGSLDLMIKVYPDGKLTPHLDKLGAGETILASPPAHTTKLDHIKDMVMIAGGSAITVAIQLCGSVLKSHFAAQVDLLMCNRGVEDVLYADILEEMQTRYASFRVVHCLSGGVPKGHVGANPKATWHNGRLSKEVIRPLKPGTHCLVSGPMGLCQAAVDIWAALGQLKETLEILDELPPPVEAKPEEQEPAELQDEVVIQTPTLHEAVAPEPELLPSPAQLPVVPQADASQKAVEQGFGGMLCAFWKPLWCQGKRAEKDDVEVSDIKLAS